MQIKPDEITSILKSRIEGLDQDGGADLSEVGTVLSIADGIARVHGLENCMSLELLEFPNDVTGLAFNLESDNVGAVLFGPWESIDEGDTVKRTGRLLEVPVGDELLGRIVDPLGNPLDGKGEINAAATLPAEGPAPGVVMRQPVEEPMLTGLKAIDAMVPIGRGQRELIIGDRQTGKSAIPIDAIIHNRNDESLRCVYVAIGQRMSTVVGVAETLEEHGALDNTIIVAAAANEAAPIKWIAPYAGAAMGEYYRDSGQHALVVFDDLTKHAHAYRQLSLLLRRPPGREAFPGDVFYLHSRLLERAAKLSDDLGGGSLTALPIIETQAGDISAYIPTNVISITDGQIFLDQDLFLGGTRPAIDVGTSVSRVGGSAQPKPMKKVAGTLRLDLSQFRELQSFAQFGSDLDPETQQTLNRGERLVETLKQDEQDVMETQDQCAIIYAGTSGWLDRIKTERVGEFQTYLLDRLHSDNSDLMNRIVDGEWEDSTENELSDAIGQAIDDFGPDFDSEGNELEEGESERTQGKGDDDEDSDTESSSDDDSRSDDDSSSDDDSDGEEQKDEDKEGAAA
ncbi:MAG TPA: F0F1 ATP synthase subunit alpha [Thermoleophilaceae bacterium]|jgi:F-type H+/Na+-transporting ATPase subunit alpha|nr:F0F1 ATP synthase subunit alpha [Thermoleophilaceae bacterium]